MEVKKTVTDILYTILSILISIVLAIVFFIIVLFIIKFAADAVFDAGDLTANYAVLSAVILTAVSLLGGAKYAE